MSSYVGNDPFEAAANATLEPRAYYGQMHVLAGFCVLQKGVGRVPFDPTQHRSENRCTEIKLELTGLPEHQLQRPLLRELIAESREWAGVVLPSLKKLGVSNPREVNGRFVCVKFVPTGRTYVDANTNETREATTFKFEALYADEAACRLAYQAHYGSPNSANGQGAPAQPTGDPAVPPSSAPTPAANNPERSTALGFLAVLVKQSGGDRAALAQRIAAMPLLAKYFTVDSLETQTLLAALPGGAL